MMDRVSGGSLERSITNAVDGAGGLNDNGRPILKPLDGGGGLSGSGRRLMKALLGGGGLNNGGRAAVKSSCGGGSSTLRALWWYPLLGWAFSALFFTFVYVGFHSKSCSTITHVANVTDHAGEGERPSVASTQQMNTAENPAELLEGLQAKQEKQQLQLIDDHGSKERDLSYCRFPKDLGMYHVLDCAVHAGRENEVQMEALGAAAPPRRVAFLFLSRGDLPLEPVWRRFFEGHEDFYSVYVHSDPKFKFANDSFFYGHQVPSERGKRFSITLVDAVRRLLAHSILDPEYGVTNSWFVLACESSIPIRSFNSTYDYLMGSQHSFVESFPPRNEPIQWFDRTTEEPFKRDQLRKGEMWWAIQRRHALMVLEDWSVYYTYKRLCTWWCAPDEQYIPTLLGIQDPDGIENRTVVYVNWHDGHRASPYTHNAADLSMDWFEDIRSRTIDREGQYHDTSKGAQSLGFFPKLTRSCYYNGVENSTCFLFARKVAGDASQHLQSLSPDILGY